MRTAGSHVVLTLLLTRRFKVISIDNHHNSHPLALSRVHKIALDALPLEASEQDKDSAQVDGHWGDLTNAQEVAAVFEQYGKGGIWGVIHIAVSDCRECIRDTCDDTSGVGLQSRWGVRGDTVGVLSKQRRSDGVAPTNHGLVRLYPLRVLVVCNRVRHPAAHPHP